MGKLNLKRLIPVPYIVPKQRLSPVVGLKLEKRLETIQAVKQNDSNLPHEF